MILFSVAMRVATFIGPPKRSNGEDGKEVLLTGTFHAENWVTAHVRPLAMSERCRRVLVISMIPVQTIGKVEFIHPPSWLVNVLGAVPARLLTFFYMGFVLRPDIVGGFHLLFNGMSASLLSRLTGAKSLYFCVGGPTEVFHGGRSENRLFGKLGAPDEFLEKRLLKAVAEIDLVITMGHGAEKFFRQNGFGSRIHVIPGGIDDTRFTPSGSPRDIDLILVARLAPVKRVDLFLQVVKKTRESLGNLRAAIIGGGPERAALEKNACEMGIERNVIFAGHQRDVDAWLKRSKVFVLTSESEGLALSMMEAMMSGLPAVVPSVGDLGDLVDDGINGFLVGDRTPETFSARILDLLTDPERLERFSKAARRSAVRHEIRAVSRKWDDILGEKRYV